MSATLRSIVQRLTALFRRRRLEDDLDDELRSHLEMSAEVNLRKGMSPADARREALRSFGGVEQTKEIYREQRGLPMIETTWQDLRFALRMLRRSPGFSLLAILCLTLGIGVPPMLGRGFLPGEDRGQSAHPVAVISHQLWQGRFKGDSAIVGKTQRLNGVIHTIVGVAPEGFFGTFVGWGMQFWVPASMEDIFEAGGYKLEDRGARWIEAYARLKPGVTLQQGQQEFAAISGRLEVEYPATNRGRAIRCWPLWQTPFNNAGTLLPTLEI